MFSVGGDRGAFVDTRHQGDGEDLRNVWPHCQ